MQERHGLRSRAARRLLLVEVVGRMDHLEDISPELAVAVLTDSAAVDEIEKAISIHDEEAVEEQVRVAYSTKARELQNAVAPSERRVAELEQELVHAGAKAAEAEIARKTPRLASGNATRRRP